MHFPTYRPRRLRRNENLRRMIRETVLTVDHLVLPLFVAPGKAVKNRVGSMPGVFQMSVDTLLDEVKSAVQLRIPAVLLFGLPVTKDEQGSEAYASEGVVQIAVQAIKERFPDLVVTDYRVAQESGVEVVKAVRAYTAELTPAAIISDENPEWTEVEAEVGLCSLIKKPLSPERLRDHLVAALVARPQTVAQPAE